MIFTSHHLLESSSSQSKESVSCAPQLTHDVEVTVFIVADPASVVSVEDVHIEVMVDLMGRNEFSQCRCHPCRRMTHVEAEKIVDVGVGVHIAPVARTMLRGPQQYVQSR